MSNFFDRLVKEYQDINEKTNSLEIFVLKEEAKPDANRTVTEVQFNYLKHQLIHMLGYRDILEKRIIDLAVAQIKTEEERVISIYDANNV